MNKFINFSGERVLSGFVEKQSILEILNVAWMADVAGIAS